MPGPNFNGPWWLNMLTGEVTFSRAHPGMGLHGAASEFLGFSSKADALAYRDANTGAQKTGPGTFVTPPHGSLPNPLTGLQAVGDFFQRLTQANTWVRIAEVVLGAALIIVGLAKLAEGTPAGKAALAIGTKAALL